jgi:hypothetical protein
MKVGKELRQKRKTGRRSEISGLSNAEAGHCIPIRPAGYFINCYTKEEIHEQNRLAKASVIRAPADLE